MNIVLINPEYPSLHDRGHGGIATYVYTMANALSKAGHSTHVLARKGTDSYALCNTVEFHTYDFVPPARFVAWFYRLLSDKIYWERGCSKGAFQVVMEIHKQESLDIVEIPEYNGLATCFPKKTPFSTVVTFHTPTVLIDEWNQRSVTFSQRAWYSYEQRAIKKAKAFRCPSKSLTEKIAQLYRVDQKIISVIRNPISTEHFDSIKSNPVKSDTNCEILFAGRLERRKGGEIMQQSIKRILEINDAIQLTFAGETEIGSSVDYRQMIERSLSEEERKRVWFLGAVNRDDLVLLYRRSDIFLIPSLFENGPYSLLEAMSARLPVIGADTGGINEVIVEGETGLLFPLDSAEILCEKIKLLVDKPDLRKKLANAAYAHITKHHAPDCIAAQSLEFYQNVVSK